MSDEEFQELGGVRVSFGRQLPVWVALAKTVPLKECPYGVSLRGFTLCEMSLSGEPFMFRYEATKMVRKEVYGMTVYCGVVFRSGKAYRVFGVRFRGESGVTYLFKVRDDTAVRDRQLRLL